MMKLLLEDPSINVNARAVRFRCATAVPLASSCEIVQTKTSITTLADAAARGNLAQCTLLLNQPGIDHTAGSAVCSAHLWLISY